MEPVHLFYHTPDPAGIFYQITGYDGRNVILRLGIISVTFKETCRGRYDNPRLVGTCYFYIRDIPI